MKQDAKALGDPTISDETRTGVIGMLNELYTPVAADDLAICVQVRLGLRVDEGTLVELAASDRAAFFSGEEKSAWICPALEFPHGTESDEFFTRSDWPVRARFVRGVLSPSQELMLLRQFSAIAMSAIEQRDTDRDEFRVLMERIDDLAIHFPTARLREMWSRYGAPRSRARILSLYHDLAEDLYGELVVGHRMSENDAAKPLEELEPAERFFGVRR